MYLLFVGSFGVLNDAARRLWQIANRKLFFYCFYHIDIFKHLACILAEHRDGGCVMADAVYVF
ncbi:hypothetical protein A9798_00990 [Edwardsiella hoshinae]|uniref:Uncharacterized protein n=1 Tax=Edwardsiella hoshinae TaxID=93378 RepID=A0ABN4STZ4_9GAMM|nr:hypothetical protein A9798_00990 [Edwardsiella hoshinae]